MIGRNKFVSLGMIFIWAFGTETVRADETVKCEVAGYDVLLRNEGDVTFPIGTKIMWHVPFARVGNTYTVDKEFEPGQSRYFPGFMAGNYMPDTEVCLVTIEAATDAP